MMQDDQIRSHLEHIEDLVLSPHAQRSTTSRGRVLNEEPSFMRTAFMRDRDRIVHSKAFRRLKHKTQVFISPIGDHYVTRLTHTIEVAQIARSISRALRLNEDLTEAIALGHDLGHTPFGHLGEEFLNERLSGGYRHAEQSLRIVERLEKDGAGLNLTWEVRQGMVNHSKGRHGLHEIADSDELLSLEAQVVRISDAIAYVNHDLLDAIRAGVLTERDVPASVQRFLGSRHSERLNALIGDVIETSWTASGVDKESDGSGPAIRMGEQIGRAASELRDFLFDHLYERPNDASANARETLDHLWTTIMADPDLIPEGYAEAGASSERRAADYLSGMTDRFAERTVADLRNGIRPRAELLGATG
ncbi:MAG: deoxyguanosinetriphosphate triphosphohydrolase [SAR202 cluster bacterium Io17-Chloro-G9]|nr:MAG: deoxyguanosinetriphosphate triphosphohydrolase [SAR202 cluster bacterium Io17-Chloro-G9]